MPSYFLLVSNPPYLSVAQYSTIKLPNLMINTVRLEITVYMDVYRMILLKVTSRGKWGSLRLRDICRNLRN